MYFKIFLKYSRKSTCMRLLLYPQIFRQNRRYYHGLPFLNLYKDVLGEPITENYAADLKRKHPKLYNLSVEQLQNTLQVLRKFGISAEDACLNPHIFCMNLISMDNYGEILQECNFTFIHPKHIIRYHTLVKSRTISQLKKEGLLKSELNLEHLLCDCFNDWPRENKFFLNFSDTKTNILTVRLSILERYLKWKFSITSEEFKDYCKNYLPLKHRPMCDIQESLNIAQKDIKFDMATIRKNGFIISSDPVNTKLILENVTTLADLDMRDVIRREPAIMKNNYKSLLEIKEILEQYNISNEAQRLGLKVYCMRPQTVRARLEHLVNLKEYQVLASNPRVLYMVVHEKKMMTRLSKIQAARKQCFSLNHLVSSSKVFNTYITSFGNKACGRDIAILISSSLHARGISNKLVLEKLRRHKYWLHTALNVIGENIHFLKKDFKDEVIFKNCQILLYPLFELENYIELLLKMRSSGTPTKSSNVELDAIYRNLNCHLWTDSQILSLVLYEIEKKYHFSGDGVWNKMDSKPTQNQVKQNAVH